MKRKKFIYIMFSTLIFILTLLSVVSFKSVSAAQNSIYTENLIPKMTSNIN